MRILPAIKTGALLAYTALAGAVLPGATGLVWAEAVNPLACGKFGLVRQVAGAALSEEEARELAGAIERCWNVATLSTEATRVSVVVGLTVGQDGKPVATSIRLIGASGGSDAAARQAYEAARRAILRCGSQGFPLPDEKYEVWQELELVFGVDGIKVRSGFKDNETGEGPSVFSL